MLLGKILGRLGNQGQPTADAKPTSPQTSLVDFANGYVEFGAGVSVHVDGSDTCIVWGEPTCVDKQQAAIASEKGDAAAWHAAIHRQGAAAARTVHGRFAAVMIGDAGAKMLAVTDRFATFPICYTSSAGEFRFGERADDVAGSSPTISVQALFNYLFFHMIPAPTTVFEGVHRLPAAHAVTWRKGEVTCAPYWQPEFDNQPNMRLAEQEARFLALVESSVAREAAAGNVGAFLSGGTDSSTIAGMLCKVTGNAAKTYSIGFDASGYDEMEYARIAARHFRTDHHEYYVTPADLLDGIPKVACHYDQPFGNSSAVPAWICASRARADGVDKLLAGDGGDELFGGNERYAKQRVFERYDLLPGVVRRFALEPILNLPGMDRLPLMSKAASYVQQARVPLPDRLQRYNLLLRTGFEEVLDPSFLAAVDANEPFETQRSWWDSIDSSSSIDHMIAFDWKYTLADNDLPKVIGTAELAGLDVGFPLMSDDLLEFSTGLPPEWKLKGQSLRWFFKHALRNFLPEEILQKQKHGFGLPFGVWACEYTDLQELARESLGSLGNRGIVKPQFLESLLGKYLPAHPGYYGEMVWILMMMELWLQSRAPEWRMT
jgi:asparagine synthase (glutamine-hydrolysing)